MSLQHTVYKILALVTMQEQRDSRDCEQH